MSEEKKDVELSAEELDEVSGGTGMNRLALGKPLAVSNTFERTIQTESPVAQIAGGVEAKLKPRAEINLEQGQGLGDDLRVKPGPNKKPSAK